LVGRKGEAEDDEVEEGIEGDEVDGEDSEEDEDEVEVDGEEEEVWGAEGEDELVGGEGVMFLMSSWVDSWVTVMKLLGLTSTS
jgi:hypothetical protein